MDEKENINHKQNLKTEFIYELYVINDFMLNTYVLIK